MQGSSLCLFEQAVQDIIITIIIIIIIIIIICIRLLHGVSCF